MPCAFVVVGVAVHFCESPMTACCTRKPKPVNVIVGAPPPLGVHVAPVFCGKSQGNHVTL